MSGGAGAAAVLPDGIAVHRALAAEPDDAVLALLNETERGRLARLRRPEDRARFVTGRRLARSALGTLLGVSPAEVPLSIGPTGRPGVDAAGGLDLSIAHAGRQVLVAVADGGRRVGVDVEGGPAAPVPDAGLLGVVCTPAERVALAALGDRARQDAFLALWTRKEAVLKVDGRGLLVDPASLELVVGGPPRVLAAPDGVPGPERLTVLDLCAARGYRAALGIVTP